MTKVFVFKNKVFCGIFNVPNSLEQLKNSFCLNNGFNQEDVFLITISAEDMQKYDIILKSPNTSRIVFEGDIKLIGTQIVDDKEVVVETFTPVTIF